MHSFPTTFTTPPQTRKRKATDSAEDASEKAKKASKIATQPTAPSRLPVTPVTELGTPTATSMDSDDEFMSEGSSQEDFEGTQDSDDGSLGEGEV